MLLLWQYSLKDQPYKTQGNDLFLLISCNVARYTNLARNFS